MHRKSFFVPMLLLDSDWTGREYPDRHMDRGTREQMIFVMVNICAPDVI